MPSQQELNELSEISKIAEDLRVRDKYQQMRELAQQIRANALSPSSGSIGSNIAAQNIGQMGETPKGPPQIPYELSMLGKSVEELQGVAGDVLSRVDSTCCIQIPAKGSPSVDTPMPPLCTVAKSIRQQREMIEQTTALLRDFAGRLQL